MLILALDTCDARGSVALLRGLELVAVEPHGTADDYSAWLLPAVDRLLASASVKLADIDVYAVAAGPGSFTGVRAGLATVKAWSEVYGRPIAAVSRLEAVAEGSKGTASFVVPFIDAHRKQIFGTVYSRQSGGDSASAVGSGEHAGLRRVEEDMVIAPAEFLARVSQLAAGSPVDWVSTDPLALAGTAEWAARAAAGSGGVVEEVSAVLAPAIGRLGHGLTVSGRLTDAISLDANYVRRCDAEVARKVGGQGGAVTVTAAGPNPRVSQRREGLRVRKFHPADAARLAELAKAAPESAQWDAESYERLQERGFSAWVIADAGGARGFLIARMVAGEAEVLNLAVAPEIRRRRHATALLNEALGEMGAAGANRVFLEVRESNRGAILFYEKAGFAANGKRNGYYRSPEEAAILLAKKLTV